MSLTAADLKPYDYTGRLTFRAWAWEFLRRNPEYRKAWRARDNGSAWGLLAPQDPSKTAIELADNGWNSSAAAPNPAKKRTLTAQQDFIWWKSELLGGSVKIVNPNYAAATIAAMPANRILLMLDLSKPVNQTLEEARRCIAAYRQGRRPKTKAHTEKWRAYLWLLDHEDKRKWISDDPRRVHDAWQQAVHLRDAGYRDLVSLDERPKKK